MKSNSLGKLKRVRDALKQKEYNKKPEHEKVINGLESMVALNCIEDIVKFLKNYPNSSSKLQEALKNEIVSLCHSLN